MNPKKVSLVINPRDGQNIAKITDILAVLAAAGWQTNLLLKKYGGETVSLAEKAIAEEADLVVAYGGDGTLNQVVNGVLKAKGKSHIGLIPGGTANEWAGEMHIPQDPVKAALALVDSKEREIDLCHVVVHDLIFPTSNEGQTSGTTEQRRKEKAKSKAKHEFLMMAGLGFDAKVIGHTSNSLKHKVGQLAFDLAAAKSLPKQQAFPVEIWERGEGKHSSDATMRWQGEAIQIIIANTRTYANMVQISNDAYLDDGVFDVCVIKSGDPISTLGQLSSIVLQHKPDNLNTEYFRGAHFSIRVPANVNLQLDGSAVKLKDYIRKADEAALEKVDPKQVMVDYRFDAFPKAIQMLVPRSYDDTLFMKKYDDRSKAVIQHETASVFTPTPEEEQEEQDEQHANEKRERLEAEQLQMQEHLEALLDHGRIVRVTGGAPNPEKKHLYIIAGGSVKQSTGEMQPVAVQVGGETTILDQNGQRVAPILLEQLQEGKSIVVDGKKSKRGVIHATHVVI